MHLPIGETQRIMIENQITSTDKMNANNNIKPCRRGITARSPTSSSFSIMPQTTRGADGVTSHPRQSHIESSILRKSPYSSMSPTPSFPAKKEVRGGDKRSPVGTFLVQAELHRHKWPKKVSILCGWDTCSFENTPVGIPIRVCEDGGYETKGCYCGLSCAAAANLSDNKISATTRGERHSLIAMIHSNLLNKRIQVAPDRECLRIFGGSLRIEEFRKTNVCDTMIIYPPMRPFAVYQTNVEGIQTDVGFQECSQNVEPWVLNIDKFDVQSSSSSKARVVQGLGKFMTVSFSKTVDEP